MNFWKAVFAVLFILSGRLAFSQTEDCESTLARASDEFSAGHFNNIPLILSPCLESFSREQRQRAYLLLTHTYLLLDDPLGARKSYLEVLMANPEFVADPNTHPIDIIYLSKKFVASPVFSWHVKAGTNISPVRVIYDLNAYGQSSTPEEYTLRAGYQAAVGGDFNYDEKIFLRGEINYSFTAYRHTSTHFNKDTKDFTDRQGWLSLPLSINYGKPVGRYRPYGYAGYAFHYLMSDKANIIITSSKPSESSETQETVVEETPTVDFMSKRNRFNQSLFVGGGLKIKFGFDFLFVDVRYHMGLRNVTKENGLYADYPAFGDNQSEDAIDNLVQSFDSSTRFGHVDDFFRLDNLSISFGFLRPLYKPRELKRAKTRSVLRNLKKNSGEDEVQSSK